jgi:hypothetical protein
VLSNLMVDADENAQTQRTKKMQKHKCKKMMMRM